MAPPAQQSPDKHHTDFLASVRSEVHSPFLEEERVQREEVEARSIERLKKVPEKSPVIETKIDEFCRNLSFIKDFTDDLDRVAGKMSVDPAKLERIAKVLQEKNVVELIYPTGVFSKIRVRLVTDLERKDKREMIGRAIESYSIVASGVPATVTILAVSGEIRPVYWVETPQIGPYTENFLEFLRDELARESPVQVEEITDPKKLEGLKEKFYASSYVRVSIEFPELSEEFRKILAGTLLHRMYGLGDLEILLADDYLEEIGINGASAPVGIYHRKFGWLKTTIVPKSEVEVYNYASQIGRKSGRDITSLNPIMDAALTTGDRVSATLFPISTSGNTITIRRFARNPWTISNFLSGKTLSVEMAAFLWQAIQYEMNLLVAGGTATGKTSALNTLCAMVPPTNRVITIEDTRELTMPKYLAWNWIPLTTRGANPEGRGEISMLDLMVASLRMRPDRIFLGEVRRQREAEVMFEAMHTGHAVYATLHADNSNQVIRRLTEPPFSIPPAELEALHLIAVQYRDRRTGIRRTYEISEVIPASSGEALSVNVLYRWRARGDVFEQKAESTRLFSDLSLHTGMSMSELKEDLKKREQILSWMVSKGISSVDSVGAVMGLYYKSPEELLGIISGGGGIEEVDSEIGV
ncbi:MAG: type II/IV secretion system ATPase subunit [archaeon]